LEYGPEQAVKDGLIHIKEYAKLKASVDLFKVNTMEMADSPDVRGLWYYGEPGTGKSRKAREDNPEAYLKSQNKWWDGYTGQKVVILDDFDKGGVCLGHHLKIWSDRYKCTGEVKGSTVPLQFDKFIITSNYSIDGLFEDPEMRAALKRRFKVTHFN